MTTRWSSAMVCAAWAVAAAATAQVRGGMHGQEFDPAGKPFSYFAQPTDVIGALYAPAASEVTPEGYLYTGFGELMFFTGNPPEPVNERIRTLHKGYLPVVEYNLQRNGVRYRFRMFGADLGGGLEGVPVNFVEVELRNSLKETRTAFLSSAYRFSPPVNGLGGLPDYRFRQRFELIPKQFTEGNTAFSSAWKYSFGGNALVRDGRILYTFPGESEPDQLSLSLIDNGFRLYRYFTGNIAGSRDPKYSLNAHTPMGVATYRVTLKPGEARTLVFKMPLAPVVKNSAEARQIESADYGQVFSRTVGRWDGLVATNPRMQFPEPKVQQFLLANTVFDLLALDKRGDHYVPNVNKFQYHRFYGGCDTAHMLIALDYMGLEDIARKGLLYSVAAQAENGAFVMENETAAEYRLWESFGYSLWGWGRHYLLTRDSDFLRQVYPGVVRAMAWEREIVKTDPLGLMPVMEITDDAGLSGAHQTGQNMWILIGIHNAITLAEAIGNNADAQRFRDEYKRYRAAFDKQLALQTAKSGGVIPPALDVTLAGNHWDNMLTLYPEPLFKPFDPRVTATIKHSRATYHEGILGYVLPMALAKKGENYEYDTTPRLHYWHTQDNSLNALVRGAAEDQELAVRDLYAMLLHTTSTHAPQEFGTVPWSEREVMGHDLIPDGPASGKTIELLRNMLVREFENDLYLYSAVSPAWLQPGKIIVVNNQPTVFGPVSATLRARADGFQVTFSHQFRQAPRRVLIRIPWYFNVQQAEADGKPLNVADGHLVITSATRAVTVKGSMRAAAPVLSYAKAVEDYKREYRQRYTEFLRTGKIRH
ncbi:MAG: hypothetical protein IT160_16280 [Bryobacterales bacterium]|nr:hypothetical protein [Bryobacterales bacterium]